jgi:hypothetical protein
MITDKSAIVFANERVRPVADELARAYRDAKTILAFWQAKGMAAFFPNDATGADDGSASDGRTPITGADVNALVFECNAIVTRYEANSSAILFSILKIAVNPE